MSSKIPQFQNNTNTSCFQFIDFPFFSTAMFDDRRLFPSGFFSCDSMFFQLCLGWHLLLETPLLLPQAMEMDYHSLH